MSSLLNSAQPSHCIAAISDGEPVDMVPVVTIMPSGLVLTLGHLNMYMTIESALALSDVITEGALCQMQVEFDGNFVQ